jgi:hypothetical protein
LGTRDSLLLNFDILNFTYDIQQKNQLILKEPHAVKAARAVDLEYKGVRVV